MLHWLQKRLISEPAADWIDDCAAWVIDEFCGPAFWDQTRLVLPDTEHFPDKVTGPEPMARYILGRVTELSGIAHWPWQLCDMRTVSPTPPRLLGMATDARFVGVEQSFSEAVLQVPFVIDQVSKPQDLVASIAQTCAQHVLWQSQQEPPGGMEHFEQAAEMLALFYGFGLMLANSAYTYRGSCARCYNPRASRQATISESETVYALALFCHLKKEPDRKVFKYLKPYLKSSFKLAQKQIRRRARHFPGPDGVGYKIQSGIASAPV